MTQEELLSKIHPNYLKHLANLYYTYIANKDNYTGYESKGVVCLWCGWHYVDYTKNCYCGKHNLYRDVFNRFFGDMSVRPFKHINMGTRSLCGLNQSLIVGLADDLDYFTELALSSPLFLKIFEAVFSNDNRNFGKQNTS